MTENKILHFKSLMKCLNTLEINADVIGLQTVFPQPETSNELGRMYGQAK